MIRAHIPWGMDFLYTIENVLKHQISGRGCNKGKEREWSDEEREFEKVLSKAL